MRSRPGKVRLRASRDELLAAATLLAEPHGLIDLRAVFGNRRLVEVEVGPGKGTFLLGRATRRPGVNLLGIEWLPRYAMYVADRARRAELTNIRVLAADAEDVFARYLPDACLSRVHIYFPDPWPKRRHHRRRLIKPPFVRDLAQSLRLGGWVGIITDHEQYFEQIHRVFDQAAALAEVPFPSPDPTGEWVRSNFECKYAADGRQFHTLAVIRYR